MPNCSVDILKLSTRIVQYHIKTIPEIVCELVEIDRLWSASFDFLSDFGFQVLSDPMPHLAKWVASPTNVDGGRPRVAHLQNEVGIDIGNPIASNGSKTFNLHEHEPIQFSVRKTPSMLSNGTSHFNQTPEPFKQYKQSNTAESFRSNIRTIQQIPTPEH